uniref:Uncharacterized protein n=1 Tax=Globodera rostochiensis TaxID=31243 RepID=A0A914HSQ8_GLORO
MPQRLNKVREGRCVRKRIEEDRHPNWNMESCSDGENLLPRKDQLSEPRHLHIPNSLTAFPSGKDLTALHSPDPVRLSTFSVIPCFDLNKNVDSHLYPEVNKKFEGAPDKIPESRIEEMNVDWTLKGKEKEEQRQEIVVKVPEKEILRKRLDVKIAKEKAISSEKGEEISPGQHRIDKDISQIKSGTHPPEFTKI